MQDAQKHLHANLQESDSQSEFDLAAAAFKEFDEAHRRWMRRVTETAWLVEGDKCTKRFFRNFEKSLLLYGDT
jgi:hypothetical protein